MQYSKVFNLNLGNSAESVTLKPFSISDSNKLLLNRGVNPELLLNSREMQRLVIACGGIPRIINYLSEQLLYHPKSISNPGTILRNLETVES